MKVGSNSTANHPSSRLQQPSSSPFARSCKKPTELCPIFAAFFAAKVGIAQRATAPAIPTHHHKNNLSKTPQNQHVKPPNSSTRTFQVRSTWHIHLTHAPKIKLAPKPKSPARPTPRRATAPHLPRGKYDFHKPAHN